ncbi:hypothetical protein K5X82_05045 [Halosquirtibacter xylanolyticus]|uniref:hypothetical protein n=1 Tax=Halosquirtibacter xylanolyticus TaxID=3374599 RepID=UPI0037486A04|nr:hypothetical protein K5X82_05045 [Prolixibacteraceae bacterium]
MEELWTDYEQGPFEDRLKAVRFHYETAVISFLNSTILGVLSIGSLLKRASWRGVMAMISYKKRG